MHAFSIQYSKKVPSRSRWIAFTIKSFVTSKTITGGERFRCQDIIIRPPREYSVGTGYNGFTSKNMKILIKVLILVYIALTSIVLCSQSKNSAEGVLRSNGKSLSSAGQTTREGTLHQIGDKLRHLELTINELFTKIADAQNVCHRNGNILKCCADDLLQNNVCVAFALTMSNFTVRVIFEVNNSTFIDEEISEQEPDPICGGLPHLHIIKFCFEPYNLAYEDETLNVCLAISGRIGIIEKDITRVDLNCFVFSRDGTISLVQPTTNATNTGIINFKAS